MDTGCEIEEWNTKSENNTTVNTTQTMQHAEHAVERKMQRGYVESDTREGMHVKNALEWSEL